MVFNNLNIGEASRRMDAFRENSQNYLDTELDDEYMELRDILKASFDKITTGQKYKVDYVFGLILYLTLKEYGFSVRDAANDDKWRFLSLCVVPDIVAKRWGKSAETRYYKQSSRIWLKTIWWYIYLSEQESIDKTRKILDGNTTDQILQLVDRIGKKGYYRDAYRNIMFYFYEAKQKNSSVGDSEFRRVMVLHTALCQTINPDLYPGGAKGYARMLFERAGIEVSDE